MIKRIVKLTLRPEAAALKAYRQSELFRNTWAKSKALFAAKAEAWSVEVVDAPA